MRILQTVSKKDHMQTNFKGFKMQKWNVPKDRAQSIDEKNGVIYLTVMFTSRIEVIKMPQIAQFWYFRWWQQRF